MAVLHKNMHYHTTVFYLSLWCLKHKVCYAMEICACIHTTQIYCPYKGNSKYERSIEISEFFLEYIYSRQESLVINVNVYLLYTLPL